MAVIFETTSSEGLLKSIRTAIDENRLTTWTYDDDGDFTNTDDALSYQAWFRPSPGKGKLIFSIFPPKTNAISTRTYATFHSRLIEAVLDNCDQEFEKASATALPYGRDIVTGPASS